MCENKKGFTLIELLAAIVILGIMAVFAIPRITNMVENNRNNVYISDAKKLIGRAEYVIRSSSSEVEKPNPGECIIISLIFLDSDDFDNPPNEGKYEKEASYVVVKNVNGTMEYSASIVEKTKNGDYRGVDLSRESILSSGTALSRIKTFLKNELVYVEDASKMTVNFINSKLGDGYVTEIDAVYNYPDLAGSSARDNSSSPKITKAALTSTSGKAYNSLDATLTLSVDDIDTPRNRLTVYYSMSGYENALTTDGENYGENNTYVKNFNFATLGYSYNGETIHIYIVVKDDKENVSKKTLTYQIHSNDPPEIDGDNSGLSCRDSDTYNDTTAKLRLSISDDIDLANQLRVCFAEGAGATCADSDFVTYESYFGDKDNKDYTFTQCPGGCSLNGDTVVLNAFVRDSNGGETSKEFRYTFHENTPPTFQKVEGDLYVKVESLTVGYHNLSVNVTVLVNDDITPKEQVRVHLTDGTNAVEDYYNPYSPMNFTFAGTYDGEARTLTVTLIDALGAVSEEKVVQYTVHEDVAPTITQLRIDSDGTACPNVDLCPTERGGSNHVIVTLEAADDITSDEQVKVCVSENSNVCVASNPGAFNRSFAEAFRNYESSYTFSIPESHPYDGNNRVRTLYVGLLDSTGHVTTASEEYTLYLNQAPVIESFNIFPNIDGEETVKIMEGTLKTYIQLIVLDDFDESETVSLVLSQDGTPKVTSTLDQFNRQNYPYTIDGQYDGSVKLIGVSLTDSYGASVSNVEEYQLYLDLPPEFTSEEEGEPVVVIGNLEPACTNDYHLCPIEEGGRYDVTVRFGVKDDITPPEELLVCISEKQSDCAANKPQNYNKTFTTEGFAFEVSHPSGFAYNDSNPNKTVYVYVKDGMGHIVNTSQNYLLYTDKAPTVMGDYHEWDQNPRVYSRSSIGNSKDIHFDIDVNDDFEADNLLKIRVCYKKGTSNTESCFTSGYVTYTNDGYDYTLPGNYDGSTYHIYARIRDSRHNTTAKETISSSVDYTVYTEQNPEILHFGVAKNSDGNVIAEFNVYDPLDTYKVCVGKTKCTTYITKDINGETLSGSTGKTYVVKYTGNLNYEGDPIDMVINVVDSHNHSVQATAVYTDYVTCTDQDSNETKYEYTFDPNRTYTDSGGHTVTNNTKISAEKCGGRCYYWVPNVNADAPVNSTCPTQGIFGYYTKTTYYRDSWFESQWCLHPETNPTQTTYEATCGYLDCFYNPKENNYHYIAIGTVPHECEEWTAEYEGVVYTADYYYKSYITSYNPGDSSITLTEIYRGAIHPGVLEAGMFAYDKNATVPYIRVLD